MNQIVTSIAARALCLVAFGVLAIGVAPGVLHGQEKKSINQPVYSEAQATRGQSVFDGTCSACHDPSRFIGPEFIDVWAGQPLSALYETVSETMPEDNPGSMEQEQYVDVVTYLLKLNDYPTGPTEIKDPAEMKAITIEAKK